MGQSRHLYTRPGPIGWWEGAALRQAELMQRGPIIAGPEEGMQLCWPLPRGSSREGGLALRAGWSSGPFWVCSDSGGKYTFRGSTGSPQRRPCVCARACSCACMLEVKDRPTADAQGSDLQARWGNGRESLGWVRTCTPVWAQPLTLYVGNYLIPLGLSFPISLAGTESCGKELRVGGWNGKGVTRGTAN